MHFSKNGSQAEIRLSRGVNSTTGELNLSPDARHNQIRTYYRALFGAWGAQHWWPAASRFEVIVGAYLTQNTAWTNVEKALTNLRQARALSVSGVRRTPLAGLERMVRPAGYFRQKAKRLKMFVEFLDQRHQGSLTRLFSLPTAKLREELLTLHGIGPETADSILLYAGNHPVFVVDAYTRRILFRHEIVGEGASYEEIRQLFQGALQPLAHKAEFSGNVREVGSALKGSAHPPSPMSTARRTALTQVYNEMHGLIVGVGKNYCRKSQPRCDECPLKQFLREGSVRSS